MKHTVLHVIALLLANSVMMPMLLACSSVGEDTVDTKPHESKTEARSMLTINRENIGTVKIVRSDLLSQESAELALCMAYRDKLKKEIGKAPRMGNDYDDEAEIEIVIGDTRREESVRLNEKIKALGGAGYGYSVSDGKICVAGTGLYLTYMALDRLLEAFMTVDTKGEPILSVPIGSEWIEKAETAQLSPTEAMDSGRKFSLRAVETVLTVEPVNGYTGLQGGATDGTYAYFASTASKTAEKGTAIIRKYDMKTWELVATSEPIPSEHSNDIAFDSKNGRLVISTCVDKDDWRGIVTVDPETLDFLEYQKGGAALRGITYLPERNQYLFGVTYGYTVMDEGFKQLASFNDGFPRLTTQGMETDGKYLYDVRWESGAEYQTVVVHTVEGRYMGTIPLWGVDGEPEHMIFDGDCFYVGCYGTNRIFRVVAEYEDWWS